MKERLENSEVTSYVWLDTNNMIADILTKHSKENLDVIDLVRENRFRLAEIEDNMVFFDGEEIKLVNRKQKDNNQGAEKASTTSD